MLHDQTLNEKKNLEDLEQDQKLGAAFSKFAA